jgi:hypothetical protein
MEAGPIITHGWWHGPSWACLVIGLCHFACARGDVSSFLASGRCDDKGRCADGYTCDTSNWQCMRTGTLSEAGQAETTRDSPAAFEAAGKFDSRETQAETANDAPIAFDASGSSDGQEAQAETANDAPITFDASGNSDSQEAQADGNIEDGSVETAGPECQQDACSCSDGLVLCGGKCVDTNTNRSHCGTCDNTCVTSAVTLACGNYVPGTCDCAGKNTRCGATGGGASLCDTTTGLCVCGGTSCGRAETCLSDGSGNTVCSCDGAAACSQGSTCCLGSGCVDLTEDANHCGACGNVCATQSYCQAGACRCRNKNGCAAGGTGTCTSDGLCNCGGVLCAPGLRCVASGGCG